MKRLLVFSLACVLLLGCTEKQMVINEPKEVKEQKEVKENSSSFNSFGSFKSFPSSIRISMPFAAQAPKGNWDMPYQEACEEASLLLVHHYLSGKPLNPDIMDKDILDLVAFEESKGLPPDIDMHQLAHVAEEKFGYHTEVVEGNDVTVERIEQEIANGNPVIVPLAGQDIGNPYYSGDGPPYHAMVILGYDNKNFITHDVGTRHGENYTYRKQVIMNAIHDWNGSVDTIRSGSKRLLVVTKN